MPRPLHASAILVLAVTMGCGQPRTDRDADAATPRRRQPVGVVAVVNDVPIHEAEVLLRTKSSAHEQGDARLRAAAAPDAAARKNVLETIIRDELIAQRAIALGLDDDEGYREALAGQEAVLATFRRQKLAELYSRHQREAVKVSEADARRYYDENSALLRRELHVQQILVRDEARIEEAHRAIAAGTPFEEVAARNFPNLPADAPRPWDLGFLRWTQLPETWRPALRTLEKGQTTDILRGPRNRFWIIKLVDERVDPQATFETWRGHIMEVLRAERVEARRAEEERALRGGARIEYVATPGPAKAAKHPEPEPEPE